MEISGLVRSVPLCMGLFMAAGIVVINGTSSFSWTCSTFFSLVITAGTCMATHFQV